MSKIQQYPNSGEKYRLALSSNMPLSPFVGLQVYQTDLLKMVVWDGSTWSEISSDNTSTRTLYLGKPNIVVNLTSGLIVWRYKAPVGHSAVITNVTFSPPVNVLGTSILAIVGNDAAATILLWYYEVPLNGTVSIDTFIPLAAGDGIAIGDTYADATDGAGIIDVIISGTVT